MKFATFKKNGHSAIGVVDTSRGEILDLSLAGDGNPAFADMLSLMDAGTGGLAAAKKAAKTWDASAAISLKNAKLLAPVPLPSQIRDASVYGTHIRQAPRGMQRLAARKRGDEAAAAKIVADAEVPPTYKQIPIYYITNRFSVIGPEATVTWPRYSDTMDFELEIGVFIGKTGSNIPKQKAAEHIFGYTIFNDFSARDQQMIEMQARLGPAKGKSFDTGNAVGPWIVTPDEIGDPQALKVEVRVNGESWSKNTTAGMLHSFEDMVAYISKDETLHSGELIGSGTVGNCCGLELDRFLKDGDTVELEVERIGILRNKVIRQK